MQVINENVQVNKDNYDLRKQIEINSIVPLTAQTASCQEDGVPDRVNQLNQSVLLLKKQIKEGQIELTNSRSEVGKSQTETEKLQNELIKSEEKFTKAKAQHQLEIQNYEKRIADLLGKAQDSMRLKSANDVLENERSKLLEKIEEQT